MYINTHAVMYADDIVTLLTVISAFESVECMEFIFPTNLCTTQNYKKSFT